MNMRSSLDSTQSQTDRQTTIEHNRVLNETNGKGVYFFFDASFFSFLLIFSVLMTKPKLNSLHQSSPVFIINSRTPS